MFNLFKKIICKPAAEKWEAEYRMEDGQTGKCFSIYEVEAVERAADKRDHKSVWFRVNGGEWFNSFEYRAV